VEAYFHLEIVKKKLEFDEIFCYITEKMITKLYFIDLENGMPIENLLKHCAPKYRSGGSNHRKRASMH
jgi:hypothetical protein